MEADAGKRSHVGVVVSLLELEDGTTRIIFDDVRSDAPHRETSWSFERFYTQERLDSRQLKDMSLPAQKYEGLGVSLLARLVALNDRSE